MSPIWAVLIGPAAMGLVFGAVVVVNRLREPHRDPRRPAAVVDPRTYRDACRRVDRLLERGDVTHARIVITSICLWLRSRSAPRLKLL